jgi:threonylcarbamoyladenosine tRNA methylthiotransferase MtaB
MLSLLVHTLGCKLNQLESEAFIDVFRHAGFSLYNPGTSPCPSVILINTCTVTSKADQKARRIIRKMLRDFPDSFILVTGCYAQLNQDEIERFDKNKSGRFFVLNGTNKENIQALPRYFDSSSSFLDTIKTIKENFLIENSKGPLNDTTANFQFSPGNFTNHTRSFLKIQDGCDNCCTYCRIRLARGTSVSLDCNKALERLRVLEANHAEAVLTGVNISQYKTKSCGSFGELINFLLTGTHKISLRLSSLAPDKIDESFIKILDNKRIKPHFHLSIQSGSKKILEKMGRSYDVQIIKKSVNLLRNVKDDPFLACDIITGFPGETEKDFIETYDLCREIGFAWMHVFPFSKRPDTPAWSFFDTVSGSEINKRVQILTDLAWRGRSDYVNRWLGRDVDVLVEKKKSSNSFFHGVSENYLKLQIHHNEENNPLSGTVIRCRLSADRKKIKLNKNFDAIASVITASSLA